MKRLIKTQRELQRALNAKKSSLTDDDIFLSDAYSAMLLHMQHGVLSHIKDDKGKVILEKLGSGEDAAIAFTDGKDTYLNYEHPRISTLTRYEKHLFFLGLKLHEDGHRLLTDFNIMKEAQDAIERNTLYPMPTGNPYVKETLETLAKGTKASVNLKKIYHDILNIIEDGYINRAITTLCPGYGACLSYEVKVNSTFDCCSLSKMRALELPDHEILSSLIFFYVVHGYEAYAESDEDDIIKKKKNRLKNLRKSPKKAPLTTIRKMMAKRIISLKMSLRASQMMAKTSIVSSLKASLKNCLEALPVLCKVQKKLITKIWKHPIQKLSRKSLKR